tara:strand:+ start:406 stop:615 length:210 start_codon:yes stop_codon:yes gene_type:complete
MPKKKTGPFKHRQSKRRKKLHIDAPLIGTALVLIAAFQIPIAIKSTLSLACISNYEQIAKSPQTWCQEL